MDLSELDIEIIIDAIKNTNNDSELISIVEKYTNKSFISLLLHDKYILNKLPSTIIENYLEDILYNYAQILSSCCINDIELMSKLISKCSAQEAHDLSRSSLLLTELRPEILYKEFPNFFDLKVILNYSPTKLEEAFLLKQLDFLDCINTGFFIKQPITKSLVKKILKNKDHVKVKRFFSSLDIFMETREAIIEPGALKYCIDKLTISKILKKYTLNLVELYTAYKIVNDDISLYFTFVATQKFPKKLIN